MEDFSEPSREEILPSLPEKKSKDFSELSREDIERKSRLCLTSIVLFYFSRGRREEMVSVLDRLPSSSDRIPVSYTHLTLPTICSV